MLGETARDGVLERVSGAGRGGRSGQWFGVPGMMASAGPTPQLELALLPQSPTPRPLSF